jgi:hypothetical protein
VGAQAIEFWTSLAEEEIYRRKNGLPVANYIDGIHDSLLQMMLAKIRNVEIEDDCEEDDEWGVQTSAGCCLQKLSVLLGSKVIPKVVEFVKTNINHADWQGRYAALIALGAITEVPDKRAIGEILAGSLSMLLNMFKDNSIKVREAISWVISKVCEHHGDVLTQT